MNFFLFVLYLVFTLILFMPFLFFYYKEHLGSAYDVIDDRAIALQEKRRLLMDNLKDLKMEQDTGKLSENEFSELSAGIIADLQRVDEEIGKSPVREIYRKNECTCGYKIPIEDAKYCPSCGKKL